MKTLRGNPFRPFFPLSLSFQRPSSSLHNDVPVCQFIPSRRKNRRVPLRSEPGFPSSFSEKFPLPRFPRSFDQVGTFPF